MLKLIASLFAMLPMLCSGSGKPDILLGQVVSISSPLVSDISSELKSGYETYFARLNAKGGINGHQVRLVQKEDGFDSVKTLKLTRELIDVDKVVALVGYLGTPGPSLIAKENLLVEKNIALIGPSTGVAKLLGEKNVFPIRATYESELAEIVLHAKAMQNKRIALIAWTAGAGPILLSAFPQIVKDGGLELVFSEGFKPTTNSADTARNLKEIIHPLSAVKPDAVVLIAGGTALYEAVRQLRTQLPSTLPLYTISSVNWQDLIDNIGLKLSQGIVISQAVPYPYSPQLPIVKSYLEDMRRVGKVPNYYGLEGYLGAAVTAEALRKAGPNPTRDSVTAALNGLGRYQFGGFEVSYSSIKRQGFERPETTLITSQGRLLR